MTNRTKYYILYAVGLAFCIIPSIAAVVSYFPLWKTLSPAVMASGVLVSASSLFLIAAVSIPPLAKAVRLIAKKTPSAWVGFMIVAIILYTISLVIRQLYIIFAIASISNLCGQVFFIAAKRYKTEDRE